ncbi:MAG: ORF6N domain-containing protein [Sulfurospirillum sp.]|nr:ORF6N domain-containing protein [Sulfurospirillum sp.]
MDIVKIENIEDLVLDIDDEKVLLDSDVAIVYGVTTKEINQAVRNNIERFPQGYIFEIDKETKNELVKDFDRFNKLKHSSVLPKVFTEKGLYMLATIIKSKIAIQTTINIIETFAKMKHLSKNIKKLSNIKDEKEQQSIMKKSGEMIAEILDDDLETNESETSFELNFAVLKFKHTIKKGK